jgi:hypothetical protein
MTAKDVIESYITDVALKLPRAQRNDVAFELRSLLHEELQARAEGAGRAADAAMAIEVLQGFGHPNVVAARYSPTLTIIDPADGPRFMRLTIVGLVAIWVLGFIATFQQPAVANLGLLQALGQWWVHVVIPSLWWPGVLVVGFGGAAWERRRSAKPLQWSPRAAESISGGRGAMALALLYIAAGLIVIFARRWLLSALSGGHAALSAYDALDFSHDFLRVQAPVALALIGVNVALLLTALVSGRWSALLRRSELALHLVWCAVLAWFALAGPVMATPAADQLCRSILGMLIVMLLWDVASKWRRRVNPAPAQSAQGPA